MAWKESSIRHNGKAFRLIGQGLCMKCGQKRNLYKVHCDYCAHESREYQRRRRGIAHLPPSGLGRPVGSTEAKAALLATSFQKEESAKPKEKEP